MQEKIHKNANAKYKARESKLKLRKTELKI